MAITKRQRADLQSTTNTPAPFGRRRLVKPAGGKMLQIC
jgi:hypothetical protein